jgi:hypothetical protein
MRLSRLALVALFGLALLSMTPALAAPIAIVGCDAGCTGTVTVSDEFGVPIASTSGTFVVDPVSGDISLPAPIGIYTPDFTASIETMTGNQDPIILFGVNATNLTLNPLNYAFGFSMPIALQEQIIARSSINYALTDGFGDSVQLFPTLGPNVLVANDHFINAPNPPVIRNKGVDVGPFCTRTVPGGGAAPGCGPYAVGPLIFGAPAGQNYNLMTVNVAFGLTGQDGALVTGLVRQDPIPEPSTVGMLGLGLGALAIARRRQSR